MAMVLRTAPCHAIKMQSVKLRVDTKAATAPQDLQEMA